MKKSTAEVKTRTVFVTSESGDTFGDEYELFYNSDDTGQYITISSDDNDALIHIPAQDINLFCKALKDLSNAKN